MQVSVNLNGTAHNVVHTDLVNATYHGPLKTVQVTTDTDNGTICFVGDIVSSINDGNTRTVVAPNATNINQEVLHLIASPEVTYYAGQTIADFYNPANSLARAIPLKAGDIFTVTVGAIVNAAVKDDYVAPVAGSNFLNDVGTTRPTTRFVGRIIETGLTVQGQSAVAIEVISN